MTEASTVYVPVEKIGIRRRASASIAVIGNPNSGKSTLFNRLTGLRQTTGNYPGVTVEKHSGIVQLGSSALELVDLPGIYCLGGFSADERIAVDVVLGRIEETPPPDGMLVVLDATQQARAGIVVRPVAEGSFSDRQRVIGQVVEVDVVPAIGARPAEDDDEKHLHDAPVFDPLVGPPKAVSTGYTQSFAEAILKEAEADERIRRKYRAGWTLNG